MATGGRHQTQMEMRDRIGDLPDELLICILSRLPTTKIRAATSILSRRWRHLWTHCPTHDHRSEDYGHPPDDVYAGIVDHCIGACRSPNLERFAADVVRPYDEARRGSSYVDSLLDEARRRAERWVQFAAGRSVKELCLRFSVERPYLEPPLSVHACGGSLTALKLGDCDLRNFPCPAEGFPSVRVLQLRGCMLPDEKLRPLLSMCPLLESLGLHYCRLLRSVEVSSSLNPCLRNLSLIGDFRVVVVHAPGLRSFEFGDDITSLSLKGVPPRLREAEIYSGHRNTSWSKRTWTKIMSAISDVEILSVGAWFFEFMAIAGVGDGRFLFGNLKELHWHEDCITDSNLDALFSFLRGCPQLEKLHISLRACKGNTVENRPVYSFVEDAEGDQPTADCDHPAAAHELVGEGSIETPVGGSMLPQLKSATIVEFSSRWHDMRLAELLLQKATVLEQLVLHSSSERDMDAGVIREQVFSLPRVSSAAQISLQTSWDYYCSPAFCLPQLKHSWAF